MKKPALSPHQQKTLALAGVFQAAALTKQIAWRGRAEEEPLEASVQSIFKTDAKDIVDVYGSISHLELGLKELITVFTTRSQPKDPEIIRYALSLVHLERRLAKKPKLLDIIQQGIQRARYQVEHFSLMHDNIFANLAGIYTDTLSTFSFRIHVVGEESLLRSPNNTNRVRTCLLAGIRSVVLWRQLGGSRLQLVFGRKKIVRAARQLLALAQQEKQVSTLSEASK